MPPRKGTPAYERWKASPAYLTWTEGQRARARKQWEAQDHAAVGRAIAGTLARRSPEQREQTREKCRARERRQDYAARAVKQRATYFGTGDVQAKLESARANGRKSNGRTDRAKLSAASRRYWADPKRRAAYGEASRKRWASKTPEQRDEWVRKLIAARCQPINGGEQQLLDMAPPGVRFTGNRTKLLRLPSWRSSYKNPDFVVEPFSRTRAVIELFGGRDYWHDEEEALALRSAYEAAGYRCLVIWYDEMRRTPDATQQRIHAFCKET